jgi:hypothetical protein
MSVKQSKTREHSSSGVSIDAGERDDQYIGSEYSPAGWEPEDREERVLSALAGNSDAVAFINEHRSEFPEADGRLGNPGHHALEAVILQIAGGEGSLAKTLRQQCADYRRELLSENPTRLEQMAIDTVLVTWVYQHLVYQGAVGRVAMPPAQLQRAQREAQRSHEGALRCLELVRNKLASRSPAPAGKETAPQPKRKGKLRLKIKSSKKPQA